MNFNVNGFLHNLLDKAGTPPADAVGKTADHNGAKQTPLFAPNGKGQSDQLFRDLALNYAPTQSSQAGQEREYKEGVQADGSYIANISPKDVGKTRWSKEIDPKDVSRAALAKAALGTGIANNEREAKQIVDNLQVGGVTTHTNKGERAVDKSDIGFGQWMKGHTNRQGSWQIQASTGDVALLRESARELKIGNPDVGLTAPSDAKQQADAGVLLGGTLALPKLAQQLPKAIVLAGEAAPPILATTVGVAGAGALIYQHVQVLKSNWEDAEKARVMPIPNITMEDAEPLPFPVPNSTPQARPYADPPARPKVQDLPDAPPQTPTDLIPVPQAKPQPQAEAKPDAPTIDTDAQPYLPDAPRNNQPPQNAPQQKPPLSPLDIAKAIGATAAGTAAGIGSKKAVDSINGTNETFVGTLRGQRIELKDVPMQTVQYTKRDRVQYEQLRKDFDRAGTGDRAKFLKSLANDPDKVAELKSFGIKDNEILKMKDGLMPNKDWQVHHKLPIDDGGTNAATNLVLMKNDPAHQAITNYQRTETGKLEPGQTKEIKFPIPPGDIYAPKPEQK